MFFWWTVTDSSKVQLSLQKSLFITTNTTVWNSITLSHCSILLMMQQFTAHWCVYSTQDVSKCRQTIRRNQHWKLKGFHTKTDIQELKMAPSSISHPPDISTPSLFCSNLHLLHPADYKFTITYWLLSFSFWRSVVFFSNICVAFWFLLMPSHVFSLHVLSCPLLGLLCRGRRERMQRGVHQAAPQSPPPLSPPLSHLRLSLQHPSHPCWRTPS